MRTALAILVTTGALAAPSLALADQCALNDPQITARAVELARKSTRVIDYCEPCKGRNVQGPFTINSVGIRGRQVEINGRLVDLAYTFIHTHGDEYTNLGLAAGCTATGVSRILRSQKSPTPPPPSVTTVVPPRSIPRTPPPRVTAAEDIGGTWNVSIRASVSTCSYQPVHRSTATWTITIANNTLSLMTEHGRELVAPLPMLERSSIRVELKNQTSAFHVSQFLKDHLYGRFLIAEKGCAIAYDVSGRRAP